MDGRCGVEFGAQSVMWGVWGWDVWGGDVPGVGHKSPSMIGNGSQRPTKGTIFTTFRDEHAETTMAKQEGKASFVTTCISHLVYGPWFIFRFVCVTCALSKTFDFFVNN